MSEQPDTSQQDMNGGRVECFWFFLPLPQPVGLPDGWRVGTVGDSRDFVVRERRAGISSSLVIRQLPRTANVFASDNADVTQAALRAAAPGSDVPDWHRNPNLVKEIRALNDSQITLAEVAVLIDGEIGSDDIDEAFLMAVGLVRHVQTTVAAVLQRAVRLISTSTLPPVINVFRGSLDLAGGPPSFDQLIGYPIEGAPPSAFGLTPEPLTAEELEGVDRALDQLARASMLAAYVDLRRDAMVQRDLEGNNRLLVATLATAGEVFLDSLLLHMLWEEGVEPAKAAQIFNRSVRHQRRVATQFPPRLKGGWKPRGTGPVADYFEDLVWLRNRVVHTGTVPTDTEASAAFDALTGLEHFCGDRLCAAGVLKRYTRTAMSFLGERGIRARNAWNNHVQTLVLDPGEPDWIDAFARFRHLVDRHLSGTLPRSGSRIDDLYLYFEVAPDNSCRFVLHDVGTLEAAVVPDASELLWSEVRTSLDKLKDHVIRTPAHERDHPVRMLLAFDRNAVGTYTWRPEADLFPDLRMYPATTTPRPRGC